MSDEVWLIARIASALAVLATAVVLGTVITRACVP